MNALTRTTMPGKIRDYLRRADVAEQLKDLRKLSPWRFSADVLGNYLAIAAVIAGVALLADGVTGMSWVTTAAIMVPAWLGAIVVIAARQHALLVLMHEGAHRTVSTDRGVNDTLSDLLCGAPLLVSVRSYRADHLTHHQHLNSAADPDWCRKTDDRQQRAQWHFPATQPLGQVLAKLYGYSVTYLLNSLAANRASQNTAVSTHTAVAAPVGPSDATLSRLRYALYGGVALALTFTDSWLGFVALWLAPMLLVLPLIMRVRSIAEHFALRHDHALTQSRTVRAGLLERALLAPHHIGLHIDHHMLASVPYFNLPALHRLLLDCPYYAENAHLNDGYFLRRRRHYAGIHVSPALPLLADDMYTQQSERLAMG